MAAYDNVSLPGAPDIAHAGNYAQMLMQGLSSLPEQYWKGQEQRYQQRQRDLFQDPENQKALTDALKTGNYMPLLQKMTVAGGAQSAQSLVPLFMKQQGQQVSDEAFDARRPKTGAAAAAPPAGRGQPQLSATGSDSTGSETVQTLAAGIGGPGRNMPPAAMDNIARALGLPHAGADVPAALEPRARQLLGSYFSRAGGGQGAPPSTAGGGGPGPGIPAAPGQPTQGPPTQEEISFYEARGRNQLRASGNWKVDSQQATGLRDAGNKDLEIAKQLREQRAKWFEPTPEMRTATSVGMDPLQFKKAETWARVEAENRGLTPDQKMARDAGLTVQEWLKEKERARVDAENQALTSEQKNAGAAGYGSPLAYENARAEGRVQAENSALTPEQKNVGAITGGPPAEALKHEIEAGQKEFDSINELGDSARQSAQKLRLAQSFANSDEYYSGPAEQLNLKFKQWAATLGGDPNVGTPQEAMRKAISDLLSEQIRAMAKSGVGRILMTEVQTMRDSIASQKITPATVRLLLEEVGRVHTVQMEIQDAANAYQQAHGHLDAGFRQIVAKYYRDNPMFTDAEIHDPKLIAPPVAPPGLNGTAAKQWAKSRGLSPGDPILTYEGSQKHARDRIPGRDIIGAP